MMPELLRTLLCCLTAFVLGALSTVQAFTILGTVYWDPRVPSTDGNDVLNWSTSAAGYVPATTINATTLVTFTGVNSNNGDCILTANATWGAIVAPTGFTRTFSDGGRTINLAGGFVMQGGTLSMSGTLQMAPAGASTSSLQVPSNQFLHTLEASLVPTSSLAMQSDLGISNLLTVTGSGSWDWNYDKTLALTASGVNHSFASTVTFTSVNITSQAALIRMAGAGSTLSLPDVSLIPGLDIQASCSLDRASAGACAIASNGFLTMADNAVLTLESNLTLNTTFTAATDNIGIRGNGGFTNLSFAGGSGFVQGGDATSPGILALNDLALAASAGVQAKVKTRVRGTATAGVDYDRIRITNDLDLVNGASVLEVDLSGITATGTVQGVIIYNAAKSTGLLNGAPTDLAVEVINNPLDLAVQLIHDALNEEFDLLVYQRQPTLGSVRLPVSSSRSILWTPVCPGTPEGMANLLAKIDAADPDEVAAYRFNASLQVFERLPILARGVPPWTGFFVATTVPFDFNFAGTPQSPVYKVPIDPGWNLIGYPPVDDGSTVWTLHSIAGLELRDISDAVLTGGARSAVIDDTLYRWNGTSYVIANTFQAGRAYWIFNADPVNSYALTFPIGGGGGGPVAVVQTSVGDSSAGPTKGGPPAPPSSQKASSSDSSGCGNGSAIACLLLLSCGFLRRRNSWR